MSYPELLLSKQGPLAHVWLAANYDRKLSKQQFLNTNIVKSSKYISSPQQTSTITLRISGQLLLGIVRIYSRKTKYLLDDVNDILYKLKNSFRYVTRITMENAVGNQAAANNASVNATGHSITLPIQETVINNLNSISLKDQSTDFDLLYQEDLNLDDDFENENQIDDSKDQLDSDEFANSNTSYEKFEDAFDKSIEYPRKSKEQQEETKGLQDIDLDLDFDLEDTSDSIDQSIEIGREAPVISHDISDISLDLGKNLEMEDVLDKPLETIEERESSPVVEHEQTNTRKRKLVGITDEGKLKTTKRKLIIDSIDEVESGISLHTLKELQQQLLNSDNDQYVTIPMTENEKLQLINEISMPYQKKRIHNIDFELSRRAEALHEQEKKEKSRKSDFDFDEDLDLSLPSLDSDSGSASSSENEELIEDFTLESQPDENSVKPTLQVASVLRDEFTSGNDVIDLEKLIEKDLKLEEPLGLTKNKTVNMKRQATKSFFELLVLATNDCISIKQDINDSNTTEIGSSITIRSKDKLFEKFL